MPLTCPFRKGIQVALIASALLCGCRKDGAETHDTPAARSDAASKDDEANHRMATIQFVQLQEKDFRSRLEKTKAGVAKLGNKTRKKLKPDLASLDAKSVRLDSLVRSLSSQSTAEIKPSVSTINAILDSANIDLSRLQKFLK